MMGVCGGGRGQTTCCKASQPQKQADAGNDKDREVQLKPGVLRTGKT